VISPRQHSPNPRNRCDPTRSQNVFRGCRSSLISEKINHVNHVLAGAFFGRVYSRIDGNRPSVVPPLSVGIKCSQKWSGALLGGQFSRDVNIEAPFSWAARVAVRRRVPSTLCSIASRVRKPRPSFGAGTGGRRGHRRARVGRKPPARFFRLLARGIFRRADGGRGGE